MPAPTLLSGRERIQTGETGQINILAVADRRVEGTRAELEGLLAGRDAEAVDVVIAEIGEVHGAPDDRRRAGDLAARVEPPGDAPRASVERIEGPVVGAEVDRRAESGRVRDGR